MRHTNNIKGNINFRKGADWEVRKRGELVDSKTVVFTDGLVTVSILTEEEAEKYRNMTPGVSITNDMIRCVAENDEEKQIIETTAKRMNRIRVKRSVNWNGKGEGYQMA